MGGSYPFEYLLFKAARYANCSVFEMKKANVYWFKWALALENEETKAENARMEAELAKAKMRGA